ncbi:MAG: CbbQ/NirQ/NorQ/GpvN family protein [Dehalococcoidales bacterium]
MSLEATGTSYSERPIEDYIFTEEPFYLPVGDEIEAFEAAYARKMPVLLEGPTGCGKTRFLEHMAWRLGQQRAARLAGTAASDSQVAGIPLITVACHDDLSASDLVGRYLLEGDSTKWIDGPLTRAVKYGAICYLDEVVEARKDTTVLIHPLADHRRVLPVEKKGELITAHEEFMLVISYNPGYQSALKDLKHSTRQRFIALEFDYPPPELERDIIQHEAGVPAATAATLAGLGQKVRNIRGQGMVEGASTRLLIYAAMLITEGLSARRAVELAVVHSVTDDAEIRRSIREIASALFE